MDEYESLNHTQWECLYHVVFIPKCRRRTLYVELRKYLGEVFRRLAEQKESRVEEGHLMPDHVHMMLRTEVCGVAGGRVHQGKERDPSGPSVRGAQAQLRRAELLGARVLRLDRRSRRTGDPSVHPQSRGRGPTVGAASITEVGRPP